MSPSPTILVADPERTSRLQLLEALGRLVPDAALIEATDGAALNHALTTAQVDLLFIDVLLPNTNGADIRQWRASTQPHGVVVLVTDILSSHWASIATRVGAYEVLLKPLSDLAVGRILAASQVLSRSLDLLVVDPSQAMRTLIRKLLSQSHFAFRIFEKSGGLEALRLIEGQSIDLAIIEMNLPDQSALEVACRINDRHPTARILMTGRGIDEGVERRLSTFGASGFLPKPFQFFDIDKAVHASFGLWHPYLINALKREAMNAALSAVTASQEHPPG